MRKFSSFISNNKNNNNIYNKTSFNDQNSGNDKFRNIMTTRLLRKKSLIVKSIQKRKKLKDKIIPKNDIYYPQFKTARSKKEKKEYKKSDKTEEEEKEKNIPFRLKIVNFQKKMDKTNYLIKNLSKENKKFFKDFEKSIIFEQKESKFNINKRKNDLN